MSDPSATAHPRAQLTAALLPDLFLRPTKFFQTVDLTKGKGWLIALWLLGMASTQGQVDKNLLQASLGTPRPGWEVLGPLIVGSWTVFWLFLLGIGVISAGLLWYIGGWWYNLRIRWSGAIAHDKRAGRLVYVFSGLVSALPSLAYAAIATGLYDSYSGAWQAEESWSLLLLIFPFWSVIVSYRGIRASFSVMTPRARLWFLILPLVAYILVFGLLGMAIGMLTGSDAGVAA
jgi:hypothetical protein